MDESQTARRNFSAPGTTSASPDGAPADVLVLGAGIGGLATALALGRRGHHITLFERDDTPPPDDAASAFAWDRTGAPQVRHSHAFLARLRNLLRDRWPDVLEALLAEGVTELRFTESLPEAMQDREPRDGDEDLVALACRRTTFEWVLRRIVTAESHVRLVDGVAVTGLEVERPEASDPPTVTGLRLDDGTVAPAPLVVVAGGRRSALPSWLADAGVELPEDEEDTGIVYLTRFFRLRPGADVPAAAGPVAVDLGYLKLGLFQGDDRTFSLTLAVRSDDAELRRRLQDPEAFLAAGATSPTVAPWLEPDRSAPTTDVYAMGGLVNRRRRFLDEAGRPRVLGLHAVGDAHTCTNPLYGRGSSLAVLQAALLADAVAAHPGDAEARAVAYEESCRREVLPWYRAAVVQDRQSREDAELAAAAEAARASGDEHGTSSAEDAGRAPAAGGGAAASDASDEVEPKAFLRSLMREGLLPAVRTDPVVFRAFLRGFNLLDPPQQIVSDADVTERILAVWQRRHELPPEAPAGVSRGELLALLDR